MLVLERASSLTECHSCHEESELPSLRFTPCHAIAGSPRIAARPAHVGRAPLACAASIARKRSRRRFASRRRALLFFVLRAFERSMASLYLRGGAFCLKRSGCGSARRGSLRAWEPLIRIPVLPRCCHSLLNERFIARASPAAQSPRAADPTAQKAARPPMPARAREGSRTRGPYLRRRRAARKMTARFS